MFKNIIILILGFLLCSLLYQDKNNVTLLKNEVGTMSDLVVDGTSYLKKSFDEKFSEKEPMVRDKFYVEGSKSSTDNIQEETFFEDKK